MARTRRTLLILGILLACFAADQASKLVARSYLEGAGIYSYLGDSFRLCFAENRGAFLSLGAGLTAQGRNLIFIGGVGAILLALLIYTLVSRSLSRFSTVALSLILAGGLSNLYDRIFNAGAVIDFLNLGYGTVLRTGIFNVADMFITAGVVMMLVESFWQPSGRSAA
jgi:signal peptidase II